MAKTRPNHFGLAKHDKIKKVYRTYKKSTSRISKFKHNCNLHSINSSYNKVYLFKELVKVDPHDAQKKQKTPKKWKLSNIKKYQKLLLLYIIVFGFRPILWP